MLSSFTSSSSSMHISHCCQVFLTLVLLISQTKVQANNLLIQSECENAENPEVCIQCLKSHHDTQATADPTNITANILDCAHNRVKNLAASFNNLLFLTKYDGVTFLAIKDCIKLHFVARASLLSAFSKLITADWVGAHVGVLTAAASLIKCHLEIDAGKSNVKWTLPSSLVSEMNAADQLTDAAKKMIEKRLPK